MWAEVVIESSMTNTSKTGDIPTPAVTASASRRTGTVFTRLIPALSTQVRATATTPRSASPSAACRARCGSSGPCTAPIMARRVVTVTRPWEHAVVADDGGAAGERVGLAITVGVAGTKFLAKVASGVAKPDGLLVVAPDAELAFLHPLPVERLWGVGRVTAAKLRNRGIATVGEAAALPEAVLVSMLGPGSGRHLHALAQNRDPRPVQVGRRRRSVGSQHALGRPPTAAGHRPEAVDAVLVSLVDRVTGRLRAAGRVGRTVVLRLRFDDFTRATRSHTLPRATDRTEAILHTARRLLDAARPLVRGRGLTMIGVAVANLDGDDAV